MTNYQPWAGRCAGIGSTMTHHDSSRENGSDELAALVRQARQWSEASPDSSAERPMLDPSTDSLRERMRRRRANRSNDGDARND
ncbi:hypothetical protein [Embleya sp. MST-111070]|uniref:hypothetical protein n=1 Tax=Embleya sp. MST-111070 TaxID=3398231 RepID=UPI003F738090